MDLCTCGEANGCMIHDESSQPSAREKRLEDLLRRVAEENDHNVNSKGLISTLTWDLASDIARELSL